MNKIPYQVTLTEGYCFIATSRSRASRGAARSVRLNYSIYLCSHGWYGISVQPPLWPSRNIRSVSVRAECSVVWFDEMREESSIFMQREYSWCVCTYVQNMNNTEGGRIETGLDELGGRGGRKRVHRARVPLGSRSQGRRATDGKARCVGRDGGFRGCEMSV